jgi:hypothetical protein
MKENLKNRTKWLHLRLNTKEYELLQTHFKKSTCPKISDFARKNLMQKPIVEKYRNESLDDIMSELIQLRVELNAIGNNFNQAVKKLHTLQQIPEFKTWIIKYESQKNKLLFFIEEIKNNIQNIAQKWLQS